jgi:hypothetical protein
MALIRGSLVPPLLLVACREQMDPESASLVTRLDGTVIYALDEQTSRRQPDEPAMQTPRLTGAQLACDFDNTHDIPISWAQIPGCRRAAI